MKYIIGYDGGGTKTVISVFDTMGHLFFHQRSSGSNVFSAGDEQFKYVISELFLAAKKQLKFENEDIIHIVLGLSGADLEEDYARLNRLVNQLFSPIPFTVLNDAWIILRSGLKTPYGATAICGTGMNSAAINHQGEKAILRALGYTLGTYGGGLDIARSGLHYAFRSEELTYKKTLLETRIPA
ncbi:MAG: BadF/BadG/BcrA/BcrD ATPase family protein, partial [Candidatus Izemoplasmatales bacterium]